VIDKIPDGEESDVLGSSWQKETWQTSQRCKTVTTMAKHRRRTFDLISSAK